MHVTPESPLVSFFSPKRKEANHIFSARLCNKDCDWAHELNKANQMLSIQTDLQSHKRTFGLCIEFKDFTSRSRSEKLVEICNNLSIYLYITPG